MTQDDVLPLAIARTLMAAQGTSVKAGLRIEAVREGYAKVTMPVSGDMLNGHGTIHGSMVFLLADSCFAYACNARNQATMGQHAAITYLCPAREGKTLIAEAREIATSGRSNTYSVEIKAGDGRMIAHFQGLSRTVGGAIIEDIERTQ